MVLLVLRRGGFEEKSRCCMSVGRSCSEYLARRVGFKRVSGVGVFVCELLRTVGQPRTGRQTGASLPFSTTYQPWRRSSASRTPTCDGDFTNKGCAALPSPLCRPLCASSVLYCSPNAYVANIPLSPIHILPVLPPPFAFAPPYLLLAYRACLAGGMVHVSIGCGMALTPFFVFLKQIHGLVEGCTRHSVGTVLLAHAL